MRRPLSVPEWRWVYGAIVLAVAVGYLYSLRGILEPWLLFALLITLIAPYAGTSRHRTIVLASALLLGVWLLVTLGSLLAPFVLALVLAYILDPAVDALQRRGLPRFAAIGVLLLPILSLIVVGVIFGVPALAGQIESLLEQLPTALSRIEGWLRATSARVARMNLPFVSPETMQRQIDMLSEERVATYIEQHQQQILERILGAVLGVGRGLGFALTILVYIVLTPVVLVYVLRDFDSITQSIADMVPEPRRAGFKHFFHEYDALLSRYLRGQVLAATIVGVLTWIGLLIAGFPFSGLVAVVAGVFNLVPYLGLVVSIIPVFIIALLSGSFLASLAKAGVVFVIVQFIDGSITGPRIVGDSVGLHPVWVMLALAIGSFFFGFVGLLLAMPAAVLIKLLLRDAVVRYRNSPVYRGEQSVEPDL